MKSKKSKNADENHPKQKTRDKLPLTLGENNQPLLIDSPGEGHHIPGQVYVIDEKGIEILDAFESQLGIAKWFLIFKNRWKTIQVFSRPLKPAKKAARWRCFTEQVFDNSFRGSR